MRQWVLNAFLIFICVAYLTLAVIFLREEPYDHMHLSDPLGNDHRNELLSSKSAPQPPAVAREGVDGGNSTLEIIPVLILACDRPEALRKVLEQVLALVDQRKFPITVSLDCQNELTEAVAISLNIRYIRQPDQSRLASEEASFNIEGYRRLSRHYRWALDQMVNVQHKDSKTLIILEDDLNVSVDLFSYFSAFSGLLEKDKTLLCVSGYNDNGKPENIDNSSPCQLWRSDFFPGLGWMTTSAIVRELLVEWPAVFWDDWLRRSQQTKGRSCIRPEVSKTTTFGKKGVSSGQFFDLHLAKIQLNREHCKYGAKEVGAMAGKAFDYKFQKEVLAAAEVSPDDLSTLKAGLTVKVICKSLKEWIYVIEILRLMPDIRSGNVRNVYKSVVPTFHRGSRVYVDVSNLVEAFRRAE